MTNLRSINLSRRSLVTSVATLPALAVPAIALASVEPDPIFAAIEKYKRLFAARVQLADEQEAAELRLNNLATRSPHVALYPKVELKGEILEDTDTVLLYRQERGAPNWGNVLDLFPQ